MTILEAAAAMRGGRTTAAALVDDSLAAIATHQPRTNAFITIDESGARAAARLADAERAQGHDRGPLHGVPISVKDIIDQAGVSTTAGSAVLTDRIASTDATVIQRLHAAGAILIGRTNLHEFALGTTSDVSAFGAVHHPRDPGRSAGGSSGGSAVAVATGMGLASIGTDTGGSVRIPAACCGVVGLKATVGEVPTDGVIPLSSSLDHVGPLTQTVADAALLFSVLSAGAHVDLSGPPRHLRLRRLGAYFEAPLAAEVRETFTHGLAALVQGGTQILQGDIAKTSRIVDVYVSIVLAEGAAWHASYLETRADRYSPSVRTRFESGRDITAVTYLHAQAARHDFTAAVDAALEDCDALLLPTLPIVAPALGSTDVTVDPASGATMPVRLAMLKHTQLFNLTGHPAISLPIPTEGWPVGLQLVGRRGETAGLLAIAATCEKLLKEGRGARRSRTS